MKKTWFLAVLCCLFFAPTFVLAAGVCGGNEITFQGLQDADDDEFIYTSYAAYKEADDESCNGGCKLSKGQYYECDNEQGCAYDKFFLTAKDSTFKGARPGEMQLYQCAFDVGDKWYSQPLSACTEMPTNYNEITNKIVNLDRRDVRIIYSNGKYCYLTGDALACFEAKKRGEPANWNGTSCNCGDVQTWNSKQKKCVQKTSNVSNKCTQGSEKITSQADCKNKGTFECVEKDGANCKCGKCNSNNNGYRGKCHPSVCTSEICQACCIKPASETIWNPTDKACQCVNGGNFTKENNQWFCKVNAGQDGVTTKCNETLMSKVAEWKTKCANHTTVLSEIEQLELYCKAKPTEDVFVRLYDALKNTVEEFCIKTSTNTTVDIKTQINEVNNAYSQLTAIHNKFRDNVSVWKDAEGNFNTARLASDTVAGVVLGTTGALVTSHVVKKNQVENGFEDIKCTIGGQNVAGWGDQFRVGIQ